MKTIKWFAAGLAFLGGLAFTASGATNIVVNGEDFQSVINSSAPGDTLIVQPGVYPDANLNFNKALTVLPSGTNGDMMQLLGTIQITGGGTSSFQSAYFGGSVQTTNTTVNFFDTTFYGPVSANGGKLNMKRTLLNNSLTLNNVVLEALRMTVVSTVNAAATIGANTSFLAVQSVFYNMVSLTGYKVWLAYSYFANGNSGNLQETNCDSILIGNKISEASAGTAIYETGGTFKAYNNLITGQLNVQGLLTLNSNTAEIVNNTMRVIALNTGYNEVLLAYGPTPITLRANIMDATSPSGGAAYAVNAIGEAGSTLFASYCDFLVNNTPSLVGVLPLSVNCLEQVDPNLASDGSLNPGSPCLNAGPPDAIYNNRDGTRNTIGYTGGPYWNPANYTNDNPMVFLLTGQQTVAKGVQTTIPINAAASAGHD